jgi:ribosomal 50S subunit-recycling heat shock protein
MRLDLFLKVTRLIPRRTIAQALCDGGKVTVNGVVAKSSREVKIGDLLVIENRNRRFTVRALLIPVGKSVKNPADYYEVLGEEKCDEF